MDRGCWVGYGRGCWVGYGDSGCTFSGDGVSQREVVAANCWEVKVLAINVLSVEEEELGKP